MRLTTRSRYGTRLVLDIAKHQDKKPVQAGEIASRQGISVKYLELLISELKKAGYIRSQRGAKGGHMLTRPPKDISVGEIVELLEGDIHLTECHRNAASCPRSSTCPTRKLWKDVEDLVHDKLYSVTIQDLIIVEQKGKSLENI